MGGGVVGSQSANIIQLLSRSVSDSESSSIRNRISIYPNSTRDEKKKKRGGRGRKSLNLYPRVAKFFTIFFFCALARTAPRVIGPLGTRGERRDEDHFDPFDPSTVCIIARHIASLLRTRQAGLVFECAYPF